ncbi:SWIM zinc finger family protein [Nocardioides sp. R-C-SC26]|uniref:SWIM zinc finger family protein n=1 Tax=Nocardioides sp. R-C-SC26 TaxID=2870414 RepID=UPI001E4CE6A3|nr:SWIM zinc finger family protein [Nocardioides sp. R-C-SC26]
MSSGPAPTAVSFAPQPPRAGGARVRSWWGKAWLRAVEEAAYAETDLKAGRALARAGTVGGLSLDRGRIVAAVSDRHGLVTVDVAVPVLDDVALTAFAEVVAAEAGRIGALMAGDLPHLLNEHAEEVGVEILPYGGELTASCTCDAWLDPCPHALAVLQQVGWLVDGDPLLLLHLRGLPRPDLLARLAALDARGPSPSGGASADAVDEGDGEGLETALDAVVRASRILTLLDDDAEVPDSLW